MFSNLILPHHLTIRAAHIGAILLHHTYTHTIRFYYVEAHIYTHGREAHA